MAELQRLRSRFERLAGPPGLFHATRVRLDAEACDAGDAHNGWREFLGHKASPFEFHTTETRAGPSHQQGCYWGAAAKLDDYTQLAAAAVGQLPLGAVLIVHHHRDARADRDQWTLGLYRAAGALEWQIAVDPRGSGGYARFGIDRGDALVAVSGFKDREALVPVLAGIVQAIRRAGPRPPRFVYAALATDLFEASARLLDQHIRDVEGGRYKPRDGALLPERIAASLGAGNVPDDIPPPATDTSWPPDDGWHFRAGRYAFLRKVNELSGMPWTVLRALAKARFPLTEDDLKRESWDGREVSSSTIRSTLTQLRNALRADYDLPEEADPVPAADRGTGRVAWSIDTDLLRRRHGKRIQR